MTVAFQRDLDHLKQELLSMGTKVEAAIRKSMAALVKQRPELVAEVISGDRAIDHQETAIEEGCLRVLALHQPVARDLRLILTVIKVNNELERMGDHAKNVAEAAEYLCKHESLPVYQDLDHMSVAAMRMVHEALQALIAQDTDLARHVRGEDDEVDDAYGDTLTHLSEVMQRSGDMVERGLHVMTAARNIERIADIATNIAKDVIFLVEGRIVRHRGDTDGHDEQG